MYAVLLCIYLKFYVSMHSDMHAYGCTRTLSNVLLCLQRLEPVATKTIVKNWSNEIFKNFKNSNCKKQTHVNQHLFFDKRQKKTQFAQSVFCQKTKASKLKVVHRRWPLRAHAPAETKKLRSY